MASRKVSAMVEEFKNFALKGNVVDLAIGVIIGAAFGKIIDSLVKHIIMPLSTARKFPTDSSSGKWSTF